MFSASKLIFSYQSSLNQSIMGNPTFVEITSSTFFDNHMLYFFRRFCVLFSTWNRDYFIITDMIFIICTFFDFKDVDSIRQINETMYFIRQLCTLLDTVQCTMYFIRHHVIHGHSLTCPQNAKIVIYYASKNHFFPSDFILPLIFFLPPIF